MRRRSSGRPIEWSNRCRKVEEMDDVEILYTGIKNYEQSRQQVDCVSERERSEGGQAMRSAHPGLLLWKGRIPEQKNLSHFV